MPARYFASAQVGDVDISADGVPAEWADIAQSEHDPHVWEEDGVVLGKGAFGTVGRGINKETGELVATLGRMFHSS